MHIPYTTLFPCVRNGLKNFTMRTSLKTPYLQLSSTTIGQQSNALFNPSHTKNVKEYNGLKKKYSGANLFENTLRQKKNSFNDAYLDTYEKFFSEYF